AQPPGFLAEGREAAGDDLRHVLLAVTPVPDDVPLPPLERLGCFLTLAAVDADLDLGVTLHRLEAVALADQEAAAGIGPGDDTKGGDFGGLAVLASLAEEANQFALLEIGEHALLAGARLTVVACLQTFDVVGPVTLAMPGRLGIEEGSGNLAIRELLEEFIGKLLGLLPHHHSNRRIIGGIASAKEDGEGQCPERRLTAGQGPPRTGGL